RGPLVILFGNMHGNEPAGTKAIDLMIKMIEVEPVTNPKFKFRGKILGLIGNLEATKKGIRFIDTDLNRSWTPEIVEIIQNSPVQSLNSEEKEIKEILDLLHKKIEEYKPEKVFYLDLHTTSSKGGIFTIVPDIKESVDVSLKLNAPVVLGLMNGVKGTSTEFFSENFANTPSISMTFESGNHDDFLSVNRAIAAITNLMTIVGNFEAEHVENRHNQLLKEFSKGLPKLSKLLYKHTISPEDKFKMNPGYKNFQKIKKNEILATDKNGIIKSPYEGRILMPLYQDMGEDGFFIIKEINDIKNCCK
ncbi:MAG TPA: succinylglutamate desuccinylase, partial [Bacteroidetes bacterium]|nr:succinylglutamate desuccinylase [Bacteroidota bacterium]